MAKKVFQKKNKPTYDGPSVQLEKDEHGKFIIDPKVFKVVRIPEGAESLKDVDEHGKLIIRKEEKQVKKLVAKTKKINTATLSDLAAALGSRYTIERNTMRNGGYRHWVIKTNGKQYFVHYALPLATAVNEIKQNGAFAFVKAHANSKWA